MIVPNKTIAVIPTENEFGKFNIEELSSFIKPLKTNRKRKWFDSHFYKCLPLSIGNQQGFAVSLPFDFDVFWKGGQNAEDLFFRFYEDEKYFNDKNHISISSHFGHGIFTINLPVILKTPQNINLMTVSPPNFLTPGLNAMTGVIESDNLRHTFTLNVKVNIPNQWVSVKAGEPVVGIIPIPRYFCDSFSLVNAEQIFDNEIINDEKKICVEHEIVRVFLKENNIDNGLDRTYFFGKDIRGNKFNDHQLPGKGG